MKYLYCNDNCSNCKKVKDDYDSQGIIYVERDASRLKNPVDNIDEEALVQASMQNMQLPVEVNTNE